MFLLLELQSAITVQFTWKEIKRLYIVFKSMWDNISRLSWNNFNLPLLHLYICNSEHFLSFPCTKNTQKLFRACILLHMHDDDEMNSEYSKHIPTEIKSGEYENKHKMHFQMQFLLWHSFLDMLLKRDRNYFCCKYLRKTFIKTLALSLKLPLTFFFSIMGFIRFCRFIKETK